MHDRSGAVVAHTPQSLAAYLAQLAEQAVQAVQAGQAGFAGAVRLGVDGPVPQDGAELADAVADALTARAVPVARVRGEHFLRARSIRLEHGDDPDAYAGLWYDLSALRREVLDPLGPGGSQRWLPRLRDPATDRPFRDATRLAPSGTVAVVDASFLARWEIADAVDLRVHLDVSPAAQARRLPEQLRSRATQAWARYLDDVDPAASATVVVRYERPGHPAVTGRPG